jgi:hypothetical protein
LLLRALNDNYTFYALPLSADRCGIQPDTSHLLEKRKADFESL